MDPIATPVPHDLPLALPAPFWLLQTLLIVSFILHLLFVTLVIGGTLLTAISQWIGRKDRGFQVLAYRLAETITVNKSLAVVLGVGPLLTISVLYTNHFYAANALTGMAWITVIPLVTIGFLLTYAHKYWWEGMARHQILHQCLIWAATLIFLIIPLIFLANVNLMLFPEHWSTVHTFLDAILLPNVVPRWLHVIAASLAVTGLYVVWLTRRPGWQEIPELATHRVRKLGYSLTFGVTGAQFILGQLVLFTLPTAGLSGPMIGVLALAAACAVPAMWWLWQEINGSSSAVSGTRFWRICICLLLTISGMATARQMYRETILAPHKAQIAAKTSDYQDKVARARKLGPVREAPSGPPGQAIFQANCGACHALERKVVGPAFTEVATIYAGKPDAFMAFVKAPSKKRPDFPTMPPMGQVPDSDLRAIADWVQTIAPRSENKP
jgi:cytochrome c